MKLIKTSDSEFIAQVIVTTALLMLFSLRQWEYDTAVSEAHFTVFNPGIGR